MRLPTRPGLCLALLILTVPVTAQPVAEASPHGIPHVLEVRADEVVTRRDVRLGVGAGTTAEAEASLTVRTSFLGPLSLRLGGTVGLTEFGEPVVGGFALGLGVEQQRGDVVSSLWVTAWRQTSAGPVQSGSPVESADPLPIANMLSVGTELSTAFEAPVGVFGGLRAYFWDDRIEGTVSGVARVGTRVRF